MNPLNIFTHRFCLDEGLHNPKWKQHSHEHQEAASRIQAILTAIESQPMLFHIDDTAESLDNDEEKVNLENKVGPLLLGAHDPQYVGTVKAICSELDHGNQVPLTPRILDKADKDVGATMVSNGSFHASLAAVLTCVRAADKLLSQGSGTGFCAIRPPGHHAGPSGPDRKAGSCGFCLFNSVAVTVAYLKQRGIRTAVVDFDVHHGNGTEECLRKLGSGCFYGSIHLLELFKDDPDSDFFPGTGDMSTNIEGEEGCWITNCPVEPLWVKKKERKRSRLVTPRGREQFVSLLTTVLIPSLRRFKPEFLIISAGFDGAHGDEGNLCVDGVISGLNLIPADFAAATKALRAECSRCLSVLEGGYGVFVPAAGKFDRSGLVESCMAHLEALRTN